MVESECCSGQDARRAAVTTAPKAGRTDTRVSGPLGPDREPARESDDLRGGFGNRASLGHNPVGVVRGTAVRPGNQDDTAFEVCVQSPCLVGTDNDRPPQTGIPISTTRAQSGGPAAT